MFVLLNMHVATCINRCCIQAYDNKELKSGDTTVKTSEEYNGFKLAREMLELNMSDAVGKRRTYTKGYLVFALTMHTALGCSKYEALRRLNFIPLPRRKEVDQYLRDTPTNSIPPKRTGCTNKRTAGRSELLNATFFCWVNIAISGDVVLYCIVVFLTYLFTCRFWD